MEGHAIYARIKHDKNVLKFLLWQSKKKRADLCIDIRE